MMQPEPFTLDTVRMNQIKKSTNIHPGFPHILCIENTKEVTQKAILFGANYNIRTQNAGMPEGITVTPSAFNHNDITYNFVSASSQTHPIEAYVVFLQSISGNTNNVRQNLHWHRADIYSRYEGGVFMHETRDPYLNYINSVDMRNINVVIDGQYQLSIDLFPTSQIKLFILSAVQFELWMHKCRGAQMPSDRNRFYDMEAMTQFFEALNKLYAPEKKGKLDDMIDDRSKEHYFSMLMDYATTEKPHFKREWDELMLNERKQFLEWINKQGMKRDEVFKAIAPPEKLKKVIKKKK